MSINLRNLFNNKFFYFILGLIIGFICCILVTKPNKSQPINPIIQIDSIQTTVDSINTRIDVQIQKVDSIKKVIVYINEDYSKLFDAVVTASDSINYLFFSDYINCYNNQRATTNCESDIFRAFKNVPTDTSTAR